MKTIPEKSIRQGITLIELMTVIAVIAILLAIAIPGWLRSREHSRGIACQENLIKIEHAKEMYIFDNNLTGGAPVSMNVLWAADNSGYLKKEPLCPCGGIYDPHPVNEDPTCSYYGLELFATTAKHTLPR